MPVVTPKIEIQLVIIIIFVPGDIQVLMWPALALAGPTLEQ